MKAGIAPNGALDRRPSGFSVGLLSPKRRNPDDYRNAHLHVAAGHGCDFRRTLRRGVAGAGEGIAARRLLAHRSGALEPGHPCLALRGPRRAHPAAGRGDQITGWPPNTREFVVEQQSDIYLPAPFSPKLEPRQLGNLYEIRIYTFKPGGIPATIDRWSTQIAERTKLSPLVGAWYSELGGLNKWCHIWAYKDAGERFRIREEARAKGIWPPKGGQPGMMLKQENMLVVPAAFSPLH